MVSQTRHSLARSSSRRASATSVRVLSSVFLQRLMIFQTPVGAPLAGYMADRAVITWRKRRGGVWVPEDRLRATLWGMAVFVPMSVLLAGLTTRFIPGTPGIVLNLMWLFMNGIGVDITLTPMSSYYVDILHSKSAETLAASG